MCVYSDIMRLFASPTPYVVCIHALLPVKHSHNTAYTHAHIQRCTHKTAWFAFNIIPSIDVLLTLECVSTPLHVYTAALQRLVVAVCVRGLRSFSGGWQLLYYYCRSRTNVSSTVVVLNIIIIIVMAGLRSSFIVKFHVSLLSSLSLE